MLSTIAEKVIILIDSIECLGQKNADLLNLS